VARNMHAVRIMSPKRLGTAPGVEAQARRRANRCPRLLGLRDRQAVRGLCGVGSLDANDGNVLSGAGDRDNEFPVRQACAVREGDVLHRSMVNSNDKPAGVQG
jgi:hypothetical protein